MHHLVLMQYTQYTPPAELQSYVRYFWSFESLNSSASSLTIKSFADQFPRLIFQDISQYEPIRNQHGSTMPVCYLSGIDTVNTEATMGAFFRTSGLVSTHTR